MKQAKSMYFGGDIVSADECDFNSSKELGLKCPFCDSGVFIRSASIRKTKGKERLVDAYFAHYPSGWQDNWDCENRSKTAQGQREVEKIKIEARNQRLRVYNAYLWSMFADELNITHRQLNHVRSVFGEAWCERTSVLVRREWHNSISDVYTILDATVQELVNTVKDGHHLLTCDLRMHQLICHEIAEFLGTNTGGFCFLKLFKFSLLQQLRAGSMSSVEWGATQIRHLYPVAHLKSIAIIVSAVSWIEQINKRSGTISQAQATGLII